MPFDFKKHLEWTDSLVLVSQLGLTMAGSILFCFYIGLQLDKWLGTRGVFLVLFTLLGIAGGGATAYRRIMDITRREPDGRDASDDRIG